MLLTSPPWNLAPLEGHGLHESVSTWLSFSVGAFWVIFAGVQIQAGPGLLAGESVLKSEASVSPLCLSSPRAPEPLRASVSSSEKWGH